MFVVIKIVSFLLLIPFIARVPRRCRVGRSLKGRANKLVNDLRNAGYHIYSDSLDDNGLAYARPLSSSSSE